METTSTTTAENAPVIGILANLLIVDDVPFPGMERASVTYDYVSAVEAAGGIPVLIPVVGGAGTIRRQIALVDGVLATGGYDPDPLLWGEQPNRRIEFVFPEVDQHQIAAVRIATELGKPLLGICRGLQIINVAFGGTLYQDLSLIPDSYIQHYQKSPKYAHGHTVTLVKDSALARTFDTEVIATNSFHHLAIKDIAPGFTVSAYAPDGVIEGIERTAGSSVLAVQWHPEMMYTKHPEMLAIFSRFIDTIKEAGRT
ncbi:MAG TPA: gamma-glutamyl-gamma-aminobutyrate hydrolase family protein [bacterium]|nr:gamma-glutamyl-gamma-aminobutyrate hydrolase family protein [bacterium]